MLLFAGTWIEFHGADCLQPSELQAESGDVRTSLVPNLTGRGCPWLNHSIVRFTMRLPPHAAGELIAFLDEICEFPFKVP